MDSLIETINELESKGFRICINPTMLNNKWYWISGVYVNNDRKAIWVDSNNGLPKAAYNSYEDALSAAINYCNEGQKRSSTKISKQKL